MTTVADFIWRRLREWGVHRVYGYAGDGIGGLIGALASTEGAIKFVQVRHQEMAPLMACATAKFTREVGVCLATSGPGAIHVPPLPHHITLKAVTLRREVRSPKPRASCWAPSCQARRNEQSPLMTAAPIAGSTPPLRD